MLLEPFQRLVLLYPCKPYWPCFFFSIFLIYPSPVHRIQTSSNAIHHPNSSAATGAQLHKLLVSGNTAIPAQSASNNNNASSELARLPGGAELNILQAGSNGTANLFRNGGKLSLVNNGNGFTFKGESGRVHLMHQANGSIGLAPIIVSASQNQNGVTNNQTTHHILTAGGGGGGQSQMAGKVVSGGGR